MFTAAQIQQILREYGFSPNRALGQNFLVDRAARDRILSAVQPQGKTILEIGPGLGALTKGLCSLAGAVTAVELDRNMVTILERTLCPIYSNLSVVQQDFLKFDLSPFCGRCWQAVGNLPYYITTPIVQKLALALPDTMTLMVQREAAERFFAQPNDRVYGPVSVWCSLFYAGDVLFPLPPQSYYPPPEVHSCVVHLCRKRDIPAPKDPSGLWRFLNAVFAMRRKTIVNNLAKLDVERSILQETLQSLGFSASARGESLGPDVLYQLYCAIGM